MVHRHGSRTRGRVDGGDKNRLVVQGNRPQVQDLAILGEGAMGPADTDAGRIFKIKGDRIGDRNVGKDILAVAVGNAGQDHAGCGRGESDAAAP